ncbi:hypothetical protein CORC01_08143, partial [Colletotrichum orchidophilum]
TKLPDKLQNDEERGRCRAQFVPRGLALLGRVNTWSLAGPALWGPESLKQEQLQLSFPATVPIVHVAMDRRRIVWSLAVFAFRMNSLRPKSFERLLGENIDRLDKLARDGHWPSFQFTAWPILGSPCARALWWTCLQSHVAQEPRVSNSWCRNPATNIVSQLGVSYHGQPRRHKVCPCSERTCTF